MDPCPPLSLVAVTVTHDSAAVLPRCLAALAEEGIGVIVVDNASSDDSVVLARAQGADVVQLPRNEGFGRASNAGIEAGAARGAQWCLLLNPDAVVKPGLRAALAEATARYPQAGLLAPRLEEEDGRVFLQPRSLLSGFLPNPAGRPIRPDGDCCVPFVSGAAMMVRTEAFQALGGFDPQIFLFYEDDDLCRRMGDAGLAVIWVNDARVVHVRGGSGPASPARTRLIRHHQALSRAIVSRKYGLKPRALRDLLISGIKLVLATLVLNRKRMSRYLGSFTGNLAALRLGRRQS
jgi:N-acetylglucosaminyl-diphospho-decaprenol L-rhamnosyltransferase